MKVAGIAGALAEVRDYDVVALLDLEGETEARRHGEICAEHARVAEDSKLGHAAVECRIASLGEARRFAEHLRHHDPRLDAFHQERAEVAMQGTHVVLSAQTETAAHDDRFLPDARVDAAANFALPHEHAEPLVEATDQLQPVEHVEQLLGRQLELRALD